MKTFLKLLNDDSGAAAAEYALILAIVGSALAVAAYTLGNTISTVALVPRLPSIEKM